MAMRNQGRGATVAALLVVLLPPALYLRFLPFFGELPRNDYYSLLLQVTVGDGFATSPRAWLAATGNEHRVTIPALAIAANVLATGGDNRALGVLALVWMGVTFWILLARLPAALRAPPWRRTLFTLVLSTLAFVPLAANNVAFGFSGSQWLLANALSVGAAALLASERRRRPGGIALLVALGLAGALTHTTALAVWPALLAGALCLDRRRGLLGALALGAVAATLLYGWEPRLMGHHPPPNLGDWKRLGLYTATLLGSPWSGRLPVAAACGAAGLAAAAALQALVLAGRAGARWPYAFWAMVQIYAVAAVLTIGVGRSGFGLGQALSSRYATLPSLFWAALLVGAGLALAARAARPRALTTIAWAGLAVVALVLCGSALRRGLDVVRAHADQGSRQRVAALAWRHGIPDPDLVAALIHPAPTELVALRPFLERFRHVPFDGSPPGPPSVPGTVAPPGEATGITGLFESVEPLAVGGAVRVRGYAFDRDGPVRQVVAVDGAGRPAGWLATGIRRRDLAPTRRGALASGWEGYVHLAALGDLEIRAGSGSSRGSVVLPVSPAVRDVMKAVARGAGADPVVSAHGVFYRAPACGGRRQEAEAAALRHLVRVADAAASGGAAVTRAPAGDGPDPGPEAGLVLCLQVERSGTYELAVRLASPAAGGALSLRLDGLPRVGHRWTLPALASWSELVVSSSNGRAVTVALSPGVHWLELFALAPGVAVDAVELQPSPGRD